MNFIYDFLVSSCLNSSDNRYSAMRWMPPPLLEHILYREVPFAQYMSAVRPISHKAAHTRVDAAVQRNHYEQ